MNNQVYDEIALEETIKAHFGVVADIDTVIAGHFPISRTGEATLFLTKKKQLFLYINSQSKTLFSDIKKIANRVGVKPELFMTPKGRPHYFDEIGREKFREVFPGRSHINEADIAFYRTLAPYNPALILVSEVKAGVIYQYDSDAQNNWRSCVKFTYRRIKTS